MTKKTPVFVALLDTRSFSFVAVGRTEAEARAAMRAAWDKHREQVDADNWLSFADGVNVVELKAGEAARDFQQFANLYE